MTSIVQIIRALSLCLVLSAPGLNAQAVYRNPVLKGDYPDPSIIRVGHDYWATSTQTRSNRSGVFPLFHSRNLADWEQKGSVFKQPPSWTNGAYWAPEISQHNRRFYVYYSALCNTADPRCAEIRGSANRHCIGVATAPVPGGPYQDLGKPLLCDPLGAIDPMVHWDGSTPYLIWKQDSNSCRGCGVPSRIWAQELSRNGESVLARKTELLASDDRTWEKNVVEGPFLVHHDGYYYLFYSGAVYGRLKVCDYGLGVARSQKLLGPYTKDPANPLMTDNEAWKCPGHGSIVETPGGEFFLLHHAYPLRPRAEDIREGVLDDIEWKADGWPAINGNHGVSSSGVVR